MRLADEYDAAQQRGEVAGHGRSKVEPYNLTFAADLGLRRDEIHEARQLRDAERGRSWPRRRCFPGRSRCKHADREHVTPCVTLAQKIENPPKRALRSYLILLGRLAPTVGIEPTTN